MTPVDVDALVVDGAVFVAPVGSRRLFGGHVDEESGEVMSIVYVIDPQALDAVG